jgi:uncharacterized protein
LEGAAGSAGRTERFDHDRLGLPSELPGTGAMARALIEAGALVDGRPGDCETPLITAASYGDAEVAKVLIDAGADIEAISAPDGGVPSATALQHAAVFGMTDVVDVLVAAGAKIRNLEMAAATGDLTGWPLGRFTPQSRLRALVFAADHQRLEVINRLIEAGTPVNRADAEWGRLPLHTVAGNGRAVSVRRLLAYGADPNLRDPRHHRTPLESARRVPAPDTAKSKPSSSPLPRTTRSPPAGGDACSAGLRATRRAFAQARRPPVVLTRGYRSAHLGEVSADGRQP